MWAPPSNIHMYARTGFASDSVEFRESREWQRVYGLLEAFHAKKYIFRPVRADAPFAQ